MKTERSEVQFGLTRIPFSIRRSARRKTVALTIEGDGALVVTAPTDAPIDKLNGIVRAKGAWVLERTRRASDLPAPPSERELVTGETVLYLGRQLRLRLVAGDAEGARIWRGRYELVVPRRLRGGAGARVVATASATDTRVGLLTLPSRSKPEGASPPACIPRMCYPSGTMPGRARPAKKRSAASRAGRTEKISVSLDTEDLRTLRQRAVKLYDGNLSAAIAEGVRRVREETGREALVAWLGRAGESTPKEREAIRMEWTAKPSKRRRVA